MKLLYVLPKNLLSFWAGKWMNFPWPKPLAAYSIRIFSQIYNINVDEAEKPLSEYKSIGDFFVRRLKKGARPIASASLVHPADSRITQMAQIKNGKLIQAKDKFYSVAQLLADEVKARAVDGGVFITYYLCPTDYHRVHSPVSGKIIAATHIPGNLWPVNDWSTENIENLFCVNERVVVEIQDDSSGDSVFVVFVGATNVGKITLAFDTEIISNQSWSRQLKKKQYPGLAIKKGEELGAFHMGSTVVMIYGPKYSSQLLPSVAKFLGQAVKMGGSF